MNSCGCAGLLGYVLCKQAPRSSEPAQCPTRPINTRMAQGKAAHSVERCRRQRETQRPRSPRALHLQCGPQSLRALFCGTRVRVRCHKLATVEGTGEPSPEAAPATATKCTMHPDQTLRPTPQRQCSALSLLEKVHGGTGWMDGALPLLKTSALHPKESKDDTLGSPPCA